MSPVIPHGITGHEPDRYAQIVGPDGRLHYSMCPPEAGFKDACPCGWRSKSPNWERTHGRQILSEMLAILREGDPTVIRAVMFMAETRAQLASSERIQRLVRRSLQQLGFQ